MILHLRAQENLVVNSKGSQSTLLFKEAQNSFQHLDFDELL